MPIQVTDAENVIEYLMPEDATVAEAAIVALITDPHETYIEAFDFSWMPLLNAITKADQEGCAGHILADYREFSKPKSKAIVVPWAKALKNWDFTLASAADGPATSQIEHQKSIVTIPADGSAPFCLTGSTNLSAPAFLESNSITVFRSSVFAAAFIERFLIHQTLNRKLHPQWQFTELTVPVIGSTASAEAAEAAITPTAPEAS